MLKEITLYTAICDRCEKDLMDAYVLPFNSEVELQAGLEVERWHDTGQLHFCPDCYTTDQNGEIKLKPIDNEQH